VASAGRKLREKGLDELADQVPWLVVRYYAYTLSIRFIQFLPFVTFLAAIFTSSRLHRTNETIAMMASGTSLHRAFLAIFASAGALAALQLVFRETVLPRASGDVMAVRQALLYARPNWEIVDHSVYDARGNELRFRRCRPAEGEGEGISAILRGAGTFQNVTASSARYGRLVAVGLRAGAEGRERTIEWLPREIAVTAADVEISARAREDPYYLSIRELDHLAHRSPTSARYQILLHLSITFALANLLLPLLGLPCLLRLERRSTLEGVALGIALCIVYFAASILCSDLGSREVLGPVVAAWLPVVIFGSLGIALFEAMPT
jgi:lipopolysaccharide export LptBFGC system permease protein LptF